MRIAVEVADAHLARALEDLLRASGHRVVRNTRQEEPPDLRIVSQRSVNGADEPPVPTLLLRAPPGGRAAADPVAALERALQEGGTVVWPEPFDPGALIRVLGGKILDAQTASHEVMAECLERAPVAWILVEPSTGRPMWVNTTARDHLGLEDETEGSIRRLPWISEAAEEVITESEGVKRTQWMNRERLVFWWTEARGQRLVGLIDAGRRLRAAERALEPLAELGRMAATMAHEIRNPLASVAGALDLLEEEADPEERTEIVKMARERLLSLRALLDEMLRHSRPIDTAPEPVDAVAAAESAAAIARSHPDVEGVEIFVEVQDGRQVEVMSHAEPLRQALTNLLLNAAQAQAGSGSIYVLISAEGSHGVIRVSDAGPGIPPEVRKRIFDPFYTTKSKGTGLGLSYVRTVVDAAGGTIDLESVPRGACFRLRLPSP
jgi:signal transduction histidine kinase